MLTGIHDLAHILKDEPWKTLFREGPFFPLRAIFFPSRTIIGLLQVKLFLCYFLYSISHNTVAELLQFYVEFNFCNKLKLLIAEHTDLQK